MDMSYGMVYGMERTERAQIAQDTRLLICVADSQCSPR